MNFSRYKFRYLLMTGTALMSLSATPVFAAACGGGNNPGSGGSVFCDNDATEVVGIQSPASDNVTITLENDAEFVINGGDPGIHLQHGATINMGANSLIDVTGNDGINVGTGALIDMAAGAAITATGNGITAQSGTVNIAAGASIGGATSIVFTGAPSDSAVVNVTGSIGNGINFGATEAQLNLFTGGSITGNVVAGSPNDILTLDGAGSASFNTDNLGTQYTGFDHLTKAGAGTWTLTGSTAEDWNLNAGTLIVEADNIDDVVTTGGTTLEFQSGGTHSGNITGAGDVVKNGGAALTLSGTNTFTGSLTVQNSTTLNLNSAAAFSNTSGVFVDQSTINFGLSLTTDRNFTIGANDATLSVAAGQTATITGDITGATGKLIKDGAGTLALTGTNTYGDGTIVSNGTLQGTTTSLQGDITNNASVVFDQAGNGAYAGDMDGTGALTIDGGGEITLTGTNTYSGGTTITNGTLIGDATSIQGDIVNNDTLRFTGGGTYADDISGSGDVQKIGGAALTLSGNNSYTGATFISSSTTLIVEDAAAISATSGITVDQSTFQFGSSFTTDRDFTIGANDATFDTGAFNNTVSGDIDGVLGRLVKAGSGTLTLTGTNTYGDGTIINGGTLAGTTTSLQGDIVNNATLVFDQAANGTYVGDMSGAGTLVVDGGGTITLTGTNNGHSGDINVNDGALEIADADAIGDGDITLVNGTRFIVGDAMTLVNNFTMSGTGGEIDTDGNNVTFSGDIDGAGILTKSGAGILTVTGTATHAGYVISAGTLAGTTTSLEGDITNNSALIFDQAGNGTYEDDISGTGTLTKNGAGTVTLSGTNTYQGDTTINNGILAITNAGAIGDGTGDIVIDAAALQFNDTFTLTQNFVLNDTFSELRVLTGETGTLSGVISGVGNLNKTGDGRLNLTGNSAGFAGFTVVNDGILAVNGSLASSWTIVQSGGTLGGTGTLGVIEVENGGTLAPGNSIGTLNVAGPVTFNPGSIYTVEVNPATSDLVNATGAITINGGTVDVRPAAGSYALLNNYTILQGASVTGVFNSVTSSSAFFDPTLSYTGTTVNLSLTRNDKNFRETAMDEGQGNTADAIEALGTGNAVYDAVVALTDEDSHMAYEALGGEHNASFGAGALQSSGAAQNTVASRLQNVVYGGYGSSPLNNLAPAAGGDDEEEDGTYTAALMETSDQAPAMDAAHAWIGGFGTSGRSDARGSGAAQDRGSYGIIAGVDKQVGQRSYIGAFAGWEDGETESDSLFSSSQITNYHAGLYGATALDGGLAVTGILNGIFHDVDTTRHVAFPGFAETENGDTTAQTFAAAIEVSKPMVHGDIAFAPFAGISLTHTRMQGYTEDGGPAALAVDDQNTTTPSTIIGLRAANQIYAGEDSSITLRGNLGWQHNFGNLEDESSMRFAVGGVSNFTVFGPGRVRNSALLGAGMDIHFKDTGANAFLDYSGNLSADARDHAVTAGFKWKF